MTRDVPAGHATPANTNPSREAVQALEPTVRLLRDQVLEAVRTAGARGLTSHECAAALRLSILTTAPRLTELRTLGLIHDSGWRRSNDSGRMATVWRAEP